MRWLRTAIGLVLAVVMLVAGAVMVGRSRTWGLALTTTAAAAFAGAAALEAGPPWFWGVALVGVAPLGMSLPAMLRFDRSAAAILMVVTIGAGLVLAWAYLGHGEAT